MSATLYSVTESKKEIYNVTQTMRNLIGHRTMSGKTCLLLVASLCHMTGNF